MAEREEIAQQNTSLKSDLAAKGLVFNDVDPAPFRETLTKSGFYREWKTKFGEEAWARLEEFTGKLA
jgi:TRAP-type C4-dicarboxylate transport system substrate-binding protein